MMHPLEGVVLETSGSYLHKFRNSSEIPVGIGHLAMPEICGKVGNSSVDIFSVPIPLEKLFDGKCVSKIVDPGAVIPGACSPA